MLIKLDVTNCKRWLYIIKTIHITLLLYFMVNLVPVIGLCDSIQSSKTISNNTVSVQDDNLKELKNKLNHLQSKLDECNRKAIIGCPRPGHTKRKGVGPVYRAIREECAKIKYEINILEKYLQSKLDECNRRAIDELTGRGHTKRKGVGPVYRAIREECAKIKYEINMLERIINNETEN